jgi:hypothetical protein
MIGSPGFNRCTVSTSLVEVPCRFADPARALSGESLPTCSRCSTGLTAIWFHTSCYDIMMESYAQDRGQDSAKGQKTPSLSELSRFHSFILNLYPRYGPASVRRGRDIASTKEGLFSPLARKILAPRFGQELLASFLLRFWTRSWIVWAHARTSSLLVTRGQAYICVSSPLPRG